MESKRDATSSNQFETTMKNDFLTLLEYFDETQQGTFGFYNGTLEFGKDFTTYASSPYKVPGFAARIANQLFCAREKMVANGALSKDDDFNVMECGGGNGNLCLHVLNYIEEMGKRDAKWKSFWDKIHYDLVECSPALVKAQKEHTKKHSGKVTITEGNALNLDAVLPDKNKKIAVALSNELIDMLQPHLLTMGKDNDIKVMQLLPIISKANLKKVLATIPTTSEDKFAALKEFEEKSNAYKEELRRNGKTECLASLGDSILISRDSFILLHRLSLKNKMPSPFKFHESAFVPADSIPELKAFLKRHPELIEHIKAENKPGEKYTANVNYINYLKGVKNKLVPNGGEVITIDYGNCSLMIRNNSMRTYSDSKVGSDFYGNPNQDMTSDVDWTKYHREAEKAGLKKTYFNKQGAMRADMFPSDVLSAKDKKVFEEKDRIGSFQISVLSNEETPDLEQMAKRFTKPSIPVSYEELAALPPLYTTEGGKIKVNLSPMDIDFIEQQIAVYDEQIKMATAKLQNKTVVINISVMPGDPAQIIQILPIMIAFWNRLKSGVLISEAEKNALLSLNSIPNRIKQYPTIEQEAALRTRRFTSKSTAPTQVSSQNLFTKPMEYKDGAEEYLKRLQSLVGKIDIEGEEKPVDIVKIDSNKKSVSFPVEWFKLLKDAQLTELSGELGIEKRVLRLRR